MKAESRKRRGLVLDGQDDYVDLPVAALPAGEYEVTAYLSKGAGRCHDEQALPAFRIQLGTGAP